MRIAEQKPLEQRLKRLAQPHLGVELLVGHFFPDAVALQTREAPLNQYRCSVLTSMSVGVEFGIIRQPQAASTAVDPPSIRVAVCSLVVPNDQIGWIARHTMATATGAEALAAWVVHVL